MALQIVIHFFKAAITLFKVLVIRVRFRVKFRVRFGLDLGLV
jgi:hypothetical protein